MDTLRSALNDIVVACFVVFMAAWMVGIVYFRLRERRTARTGGPSLGGFLLARAGVAVVVVGVLRSSGVRRSGFWRHVEYWNPAIAATGAVIAIVATALLLWARWTLGAMWASVPMVRREHRLVTRGPYGVVRHPIYTGLLALALGATLTFGFGGWLLLLALVILFVLRRVYVEDRLMAGEFGAQYDAYRARVPALFPSSPVFSFSSSETDRK